MQRNPKRWETQTKMAEERSNIGVVSIKANGSRSSADRQWGQNLKPECVYSV